MARKRLTKEIILSTAVELLEQGGYEDFSMRELAAALGVQVSSLYNHVKGIEELYNEICRLTVQRLQDMQPTQTEGQTPEEMLCGFARVFRAFVRENRELYRIMIATDCTMMSELGSLCHDVWEQLGLGKQECVYWEKTLLSLLYGFVFQESVIHSFPSNEIAEHCFSVAMQCFLDGLHQALGGNEERSAT